MIYVAYFILFFAILKLLVALINLLFPQRFSSNQDDSENNLVSVLIPARNEEKNIANLLEDLIQQDYKNLEIIVFNDQSEDDTATIVQDFLKKDSRIKIIQSEGLPNGWLGKNFACHSLAKQANGDFFLFLDADVRLKRDLISKTLLFAKKHRLGLLSIFPKQEMKSIGEWFTVPIMNYILLSLLPLIFVRKSFFTSHSAANGQFMLFDAIHYKKHFPHELMKREKVEDIKISRFFKRKKIPIACVASTDAITCRMYQNYGEAVNGFSKNFIMFFGGSFVIAILFWLIATLGIFFLLNIFSIELIILYLFVVILTRVFVSIVSKQNLVLNILYSIPQLLTMGVIIYRSLINRFKNSYTWKGRLV